MKRLLDAVAGYILAVFAAALVITISVTPMSSWGPSGNVAWPQPLLDIAIFWISVASRLAVAAFVPALIGIVISNITGLRTTLFYCLWAIATAIGLTLATSAKLSIESLITLAVAGFVAGIAFRVMNPTTKASDSASDLD